MKHNYLGQIIWPIPERLVGIINKFFPILSVNYLWIYGTKYDLKYMGAVLVWTKRFGKEFHPKWIKEMEELEHEQRQQRKSDVQSERESAVSR